MLHGMPVSVKVFSALDTDEECPVSVREGRNYIEKCFKNDIKTVERMPYKHSENPALEFSEVFFRYEKNGRDVLSNLSFKVYEGETICILGGNGSGKTTMLLAAEDLVKPYSGTIKVFGRKLKDYKNMSLRNGVIAYLPQDVQTVFMKNTVREELENVDLSMLPFDLSYLFDRHPYDISGGEQQLVALAIVLNTKPKILLMDEPTKGLDACTRNGFVKIVKSLKEKGITVVIVTHEVELAAAVSDRCALIFRGEITSYDETNRFFTESTFYTTAASRLTRGFYDNCVTTEDVVGLIKANGRKDRS